MLGLFLIDFLFSSSVYSQTCRPTPQNNACSTNKDCGCLPLVNSPNAGICGFLLLNCTRLERCQTTSNTCKKSDHICIYHPECQDVPVCYPMSMIDQRVCPFSDGKTLKS